MVITHYLLNPPPLIRLGPDGEYHLDRLRTIAQFHLGFTIPENMDMRRFVIVDKYNDPQPGGAQDRYHRIKPA